MSTDQSLTPTRIARPYYFFKLPESAREWDSDPHSFKLQSFTIGQELDALNECGLAGRLDSKFDFALLQRCMVEVDEAKVDQALGLLEKWSQKARACARRALNRISQPSDAEDQAFFASMVVSPG
jgi:hypothetical protein